MLEKIRDNSDILYQVITGDETWVFQYDAETKRQSMQWKTTELPQSKKARMSKSKIKVTLIAFFKQKDLIHHEFMPKGKTVNPYFYQQVLICLHDRVWRTKRALWSDKSWLLHHENALAHNAVSERHLLVKNQIAAPDHPPCSQDVAPCDFLAFSQAEDCDKRNSFFIFRRNQGLSDKGTKEPPT